MNVEYIDDTVSDDESMQINTDYLEAPSKPILKRQRQVSFITLDDNQMLRHQDSVCTSPIERSEKKLKSLFKYFKLFEKN